MMKVFEVPLKVNTTGKGAYDAFMTVYAPNNELDFKINKNRPAVVIFPGGAYVGTYAGEAEPIALKFAAAGACAFVVWYSTKNKCPEQPPRFPQALVEGFLAVKYVRDHAAEFGINPHNVATLGFSAGGHLCACTGTLWKLPMLDEYLPGDRADYRPDKLILCYAAIKSREPCYTGMFDHLFDGNKTEEMMDLMSLELQVAEDTPPSFLWHTFSDPVVPVRSALEFALALAKYKIPCEMHLYPQGGHGLCLANHVTSDTWAPDAPFYAAEWIDHAIAFLFNEELLRPLP